MTPTKIVKCTHRFLRVKVGGVCPICTTGDLSRVNPSPPPPVDPVEVFAMLRAVDLEIQRREELRLRASFYAFFKASWHVLEPSTPLEDNWHLRYVADHLQAQYAAWKERKQNPEYRQDLQNGVYNQPPGTSKSRMISVAFNAWVWLDDPTFSVLAISANPNVALRDADLLRNLIESKWYRETFKVEWRIRDDKKAVGAFQLATLDTDNRYLLLGRRRSLGITAKITGERADCILVDDPHDAFEVFSDTKREAVIAKWKNAIRNRLNSLRSSLRIVIMQRVHPQDLTVAILRNKKIPFFNVRLKMEFDPDDPPKSPIGLNDPRREKGELLQPNRFDANTLAAEKEDMGEFVYEAQYNQTCEDTNAGIWHLDWIRYYRLDGQNAILNRPVGACQLPAMVLSPDRWGKYFDHYYVTIDAAFKSNESSHARKGTVRSEVGFFVLGQKGPDLFIVEDLTADMSYPKMMDLIEDKIAQYSPTAVYLEDKANGSAAESELRLKYPQIVLVEPNGGKEARAQAAAPTVRSGHLYVLEGAAWLTALLAGPDSITVFPRGRRDDRIDALSQAIIELRPSTNSAARMRRLADAGAKPWRTAFG